MKYAIELNNISKTFIDQNRHTFHALKDVDLRIKDGEFFVLLGPSGCGKSTLLRIMCGLEKKFTGTATLSPEISPNDLGFIFQQFALLPWLNVYKNVEMGILACEPDKQKRKTAVEAQLIKMGLENFAEKYPRELSGGLKQRVGIARALVRNPKIIFMDEPFSALDSFTAKILREEMLRLWHEEKRTIVMVTHNTEESLQLADRIAVMSSRPGTIEIIVENDLPRPRQLRTKEFFELEDKLVSYVRI